MTAAVSALLGQARKLAESGHLDVAAARCREAIALEPDNPEAHFELGVIALRSGRPRVAIAHLSRAVQFDSSRPGYFNLLGTAHSIAGRLQEGAHCFLRSIELEAGNSLVHCNLANNYRDQGRLPDAERHYRAALSTDPDFFEAYMGLADVLARRGEPVAAADVCKRALLVRPGEPEAVVKLARALQRLEQYAEAAGVLRTIAATRPDDPGVQNLLGVSLMRVGRFDEALTHYRRAIDCDPRAAAPHVNLGDALAARGDLRGALASFGAALEIEPTHAATHSNLLLTMNYLPDISQEELYRESVQFDLRHCRDLAGGGASCGNSNDEARVLRVGYLSPDFRAHSVARFTRNLFGAHHRGAVEVFCYADVVKRDATTQEFRDQADRWLSIVGMTDAEVAGRIKGDRIDILVDLTGHTSKNRLLVFARKPAPIQVSWLGYPNTTGMQAMDYRFTDAVADPPGAADRLHAEKLVRLPHGFLCYQADDATIPVAPPPSRERGYVTLGSFNNLAKLSSDAVQLWSEILKRIPTARLALKSGPLVDEATRARCLERFVRRGIAPDRVDLVGMHPSRDAHLRMYSGIDIALDPFPYNGTTTTFEALWMGVPVVCLRGDRHAARVGASILHHGEIPELIAETRDDYVERVRELADEPRRLTILRASLRDRLLGSALMNVPLFVESLECAYRDMWTAWCASAGEKNPG